VNDAVVIFVAGIGGVFIGMSCLYAAIKLISMIAGRLERGEAEE
jgi:hypothetical protein